MRCMKCLKDVEFDDIGFRYHDIYVCKSCHKEEDRMPYTEQTLKTFNKERNQVIKQDSGKPRWELVPMKALEGIPIVMADAIEPTEQFPEGRYEIHSWQKVDPTRYLAALVRHVIELQAGQEFTEDTGMRIIDAILTNAMFLSWFIQNGYDIKNLVPKGNFDVPEFMHPDAQKEESIDVVECCGCPYENISCDELDCPTAEEVQAMERIKESGL